MSSLYKYGILIAVVTIFGVICKFIYSNVSARIDVLEQENANLNIAVAKLETSYEKTANILTEWVKATNAIHARKEKIVDEIDAKQNSGWDGAVLPDDYLGVLRKAGIYREGDSADTTGSSDAGAGDSKASGKQK